MCGGNEAISWHHRHVGKGGLREKRWLRHEQRKGMAKSKAGKREKTSKEGGAHSARICSREACLYILVDNIVMRSSGRL